MRAYMPYSSLVVGTGIAVSLYESCDGRAWEAVLRSSRFSSAIYSVDGKAGSIGTPFTSSVQEIATPGT
jgi:hypothetical protein